MILSYDPTHTQELGKSSNFASLGCRHFSGTLPAGGRTGDAQKMILVYSGWELVYRAQVD
jgi:hypothetical protein